MISLIPLFGIVFGMVTTVAVVLTLARVRNRRLELQTSVQTKLIERFSSAPELIEFLQSPTGREFVNGVQSAPAMITRERIITSVSRSIMLTFVGLAFVGISWWTGVEELMVPGMIFFFLGAGYVVASYVSYRLSIRLGLTDPPLNLPDAQRSAAPPVES